MRSLAYIPIFLLLIFQFLAEKRSTEKRISVGLKPLEQGVEIQGVQPGGPAEEAGLRDGDVVLSIAGRPIESLLDYDVTAETFARGQPVTYEVRRGDETLNLTVVPGTTIDWVSFLLNLLLVLAFLSMGLLTLARRPGTLPANLLFWLFLLVGFEMALPHGAVGAPVVAVLTNTAVLLLSGAQFGTMLHLACLIPQRQPWLRYRPWVVPTLYAVGLGFWTLAAAIYTVTMVMGQDAIPWAFNLFIQSLLGPAMVVWATLLMVFLSIPTVCHPTRQGRRQAGLVLLGALPWALYTYVTETLSFLEIDGPAWIETGWLLRLTLLAIPLSIFVVLQMQSVIQTILLMRLTSQLQDITSIEKISELISRDLNLAFHTKCNYVFFREESGSDLTSVHSSGARVGVDNIPEGFEILKIADRSGEALTFPDDLESELPGAEVRWLQRLRAKLVVPVMSTEHRLIGLLILGEKASEEPYIEHDLQIIRSLAGQIALAYENIGLHVQVHEQDRVQREMLERFEEQEIFLVKECPVCRICYDSDVESCPEDGGKLALTLPVERTIDERYRLDKVLGKGGVAVVYQALDLRLDRTVAVKVLARSVTDAPEASRRFVREAQIVARLAHPRIVTIHDFGKTRQGCAYLVMEFLEGSTLGQISRRHGSQDPEQAAELFDSILDGLAAAHRMGVVHRDLKPDNVLISASENGDGRAEAVKLLDFGLAKFHPHSGIDNTNLTMPGFVIGTLAYMAPEQLNGEEADERSDLFAVGVMVFEALVGRKPFKGRTPSQVLASMRRTPVEIPGESPATQRLQEVLVRCLEEDPAERYPSVEALREDLIPAIRSAHRLR
ncbi:MAG: protein kinase [Acidobacteriota bacterium]